MKGQETRQRIIEQAAPVFNERGFSGCSISQIMEATGLEKGGIYRHFASKEALAEEALRFALDRARRLHTDDLERLPTASAKLRAAIDRFAREPSPMRGGCPLMNAAVDADNGNPQLRRLARDAFTDWKSRLATIVQRGIASGEFRAEVNPSQVADMVIASLEGALVLHRIKASPDALGNVRDVLHGFVDGLVR